MHADSFICEIIGCLFNCHLQLSSCLWVWGAFACTMYKYASWRGKHALCWIIIIIIIWLNKHGTEDCSIIWVPWSVWITLKLIRRWSFKKKKKRIKRDRFANHEEVILACHIRINNRGGPFKAVDKWIHRFWSALVDVKIGSYIYRVSKTSLPDGGRPLLCEKWI